MKAFYRNADIEAAVEARLMELERAMGKPLLELGACVRRHLDGVDFHHWHGARLPREPITTQSARR